MNNQRREPWESQPRPFRKREEIEAPHSSVGKTSACKAGDLGSIHGSGRFPRRRKWQPTPVFLPGESHGQRSLAGYSSWGHRSRTWDCKSLKKGIRKVRTLQTKKAACVQSPLEKAQCISGPVRN